MLLSGCLFCRHHLSGFCELTGIGWIALFKESLMRFFTQMSGTWVGRAGTNGPGGVSLPPHDFSLHEAGLRFIDEVAGFPQSECGRQPGGSYKASYDLVLDVLEHYFPTFCWSNKSPIQIQGENESYSQWQK